jgi:hypothetical protein
VSADAISTVALADVIASCPKIRIFRQVGKSDYEAIGIPVGLLPTPLLIGVQPDGFQVAFSFRT